MGAEQPLGVRFWNRQLAQSLLVQLTELLRVVGHFTTVFRIHRGKAVAATGREGY
ncbi:MAG TPA: hypothetical protein VE505_04510 [Vicinamibacterales bacterium]|jgi:hypothetical protein|nr:hypothetical protein [Vicinamibacterales bacterium]